MKQSSLTILRNYFTAVIPYCDKQKGLNLLHSLGYNCKELNAETCLKATVEYRDQFLKPFQKIADAAVNSPKFQAHKKLAGGETVQLDKATKDGSMSSKDQTQAAYDFIKLFSDTINGYLNQGAANNNAEAARLQAEAELQNAKNSGASIEGQSNTGLIIAIVVCVCVLILGGVAIAVFKKN